MYSTRSAVGIRDFVRACVAEQRVGGSRVIDGAHKHRHIDRGRVFDPRCVGPISGQQGGGSGREPFEGVHDLRAPKVQYELTRMTAFHREDKVRFAHQISADEPAAVRTKIKTAFLHHLHGFRARAMAVEQEPRARDRNGHRSPRAGLDEQYAGHG